MAIHSAQCCLRARERARVRGFWVKLFARFTWVTSNSEYDCVSCSFHRTLADRRKFDRYGATTTPVHRVSSLSWTAPTEIEWTKLGKSSTKLSTTEKCKMRSFLFSPTSRTSRMVRSLSVHALNCGIVIDHFRLYCYDINFRAHWTAEDINSFLNTAVCALKFGSFQGWWIATRSDFYVMNHFESDFEKYAFG